MFLVNIVMEMNRRIVLLWNDKEIEWIVFLEIIEVGFMSNAIEHLTEEISKQSTEGNY